MTTAFVLSGGGSLGAIQVGMLQALADFHIQPDLLVGTSAGALNGAFIAGHGPDADGLDALGGVWARLRARTVFSLAPRQTLTALAGSSTGVCSDRGLRALLDQHLQYDALEDAPIPLVVVTTDLLTGREVALSTGDARRAVLASCAIPAVFPPVIHEDKVLVDGGLANNSAVSQAVLAGADTVYVLTSGYACALTHLPRTPWGVATHALTLLTHQRLAADVAFYADRVDLIVLPTPCPLHVSPIDFGRARELTRVGRDLARQWLTQEGGRRPHPERYLGLHDHMRESKNSDHVAPATSPG
ncbi:MAG TPA: patatin-like phospholipase family protein [Nocardioides sp.]|uniref:patatin-like phospholipase family protein n=1 Tax=Nocardioides sp. TaxID=35761 RepID=UPI002F41F7FD